MKKIVFVLILFCVQVSFAQNPRWLLKAQKIQLLVSKRDEMRKLLGKPESESEHAEYFRIKGARLRISYSYGDCKGGYRISKGTVNEIDIKPNKIVKPSILGISFDYLNSDEFETEKESDTPNVIYYNDKLGVSYTTIYGKISAISYYPSDSYDYLLCENDKN